MKINKLCASLCVMGLVLGGGCEDDDNDSHPSDTNNVAESADAAAVNSPGGSDASTELLGAWKGPAGTSQGETKVDLKDYVIWPEEAPGISGIRCGTITWANGEKRDIIDARYDPPELILYPEGSSDLSDAGDEVWDLTYDGTSLSGKGTKMDGSTYKVFLTRP